MRLIDYARHLNLRQWREVAILTGKTTAELALTDVRYIRTQVRRQMWVHPRGMYWYRFYRELLFAIGGRP